MFKVDEKWLEIAEEKYPGFIEMVNRYENKELPRCPFCGSEDTAVTNVGIVGMTIHLAAATTKFHLRPNGKPGKYRCNSCKRYFDEGQVKKRGFSILRLKRRKK